MSKLSRLIRKAIWSQRVFEFWQKLGVHVTRKHYYSPIPDTAEYHYLAWKRLANQLGFDFSERDNERLKGVSPAS